MELNFEELSAEIEKKLRKARSMSLATRAGEGVAARTVCCQNDGMTAFFITHKDSDKVKQMRDNPNVALVIDNMRITAEAELFGHPQGKPEYMRINKKKFPIYAKIYKSTSDDLLILFHPVKIKIYKYVGQPCEDVLDVKKAKAYRVL